MEIFDPAEVHVPCPPLSMARYNISYESQIEEEEFPASNYLDGFKGSKMLLLGSKTIIYDIQVYFFYLGEREITVSQSYVVHVVCCCQFVLIPRSDLRESEHSPI